MFLHVKNVLSKPEIDQIRELAKTVKFVDGRVSNPDSEIKKNEQADIRDPSQTLASRLVENALKKNEEAAAFMFLKRMAPPLLARYEPGMTYGAHADAPFMTIQNAPLRADISCTVFIGDPASYQGGELCIHLGSEEVLIKGEPGSAILYPSTTLHEVKPVTSGQRLVLITFIESNIPDQTDRELLYTLNEVYALEGLKMSWENRSRLQFVISSLHRKWAR
ncbi:MAG TPA: Fe2+-dependent dioxygenase [Rhizomicrobium sp.]|jgi:PKHD-type hydroxylase|nr:Fe2+-dependent dioxygenase [Rhizomicrobium sp.]